VIRLGRAGRDSVVRIATRYGLDGPGIESLERKIGIIIVLRIPIDECYTDDSLCMQEGQLQFKLDKFVDNEILSILRRRFEDCVMYESPDHKVKCQPLFDRYNEGVENWFIKYGDLGAYGRVEDAFVKQKHRMTKGMPSWCSRQWNERLWAVTRQPLK